MSASEYRKAVGDRVQDAREVFEKRQRDRGEAIWTQGQIAEQVQMTPDAFSRSVHGLRSFDTAELARVAHLFGADLHYLITGEPDPLTVKVAARHTFDPETGQYGNEAESQDAETRDGVILAYRQSRTWLPVNENTLPSTAAECRTALGEDFVPEFADRVEDRLGVDVVRLPDLRTDYALTVAGQQVILLRTQGNWFRSNWSLAHELGHLCLGHHDADATHRNAQVEREANAFAGDLLLPEDLVRSIDWTQADGAQTSMFVWAAGVSTEALKNRLNTLGVRYSAQVGEWLSPPTQRLFRNHPTDVTAKTMMDGHAHAFATIHDPITQRMSRSAERRIPVRLAEAHREGIESGRLAAGTLGWLLDVDPESLALNRPEPPPLSSTELAELADVLGIDLHA